MTKTELIRKIKATLARGRWAQAVKEYALNGAENWKQYSWGGNALAYDYQIAKHYCTPSEFKRMREGDRKPNAGEEWLDVQARALYPACKLVKSCYR